MARQYLAEGLTGAFPFIPDAKKIVVESLPNGGTRTRIPGRFSVCDCINGNKRRYGKRVWEKNMETGSTLMQSIAKNSAFGLLEHPKDGQVDLNSNISHLVTSAKLQEGIDPRTGKQVWEVVGEIQVLDAPGFPSGQRLKSLIEMTNYNPMVSSRGFGSLVRADDGVDDVQDDYVCEGWDVIIKPSFETAELRPNREITATESKVKTVTETVGINTNTPTLTVDTTSKLTVPSPEVKVPMSEAGMLLPPKCKACGKHDQDCACEEPDPEPWCRMTPEELKKHFKEIRKSKKQTETLQTSSTTEKVYETSHKTMNINEIKQALAALKSQDPSKLQPSQFAENMSQLSALHQEVANYVAEDAKRSWQGTQLHNEIALVESSWSDIQQTPVKKAAKLNEDNTKLMQVIKAVAQTGLTYKNKLGESAKSAGRQTALLNEVVNRGQAWRQKAKTLESNSAAYKRRFMMASEALQQLATKYKADVTELGKRVIQLEFAEKATTPEIQKMLKEATKPRHIIDVRNILEGKTTTKPAVTETKTAKPADKKPAITEDNKSKAAGTVSGNFSVVSQTPRDPRGLSESIDMVNRLSKSTATA